MHTERYTAKFLCQYISVQVRKHVPEWSQPNSLGIVHDFCSSQEPGWSSYEAFEMKLCLSVHYSTRRSASSKFISDSNCSPKTCTR